MINRVYLQMRNTPAYAGKTRIRIGEFLNSGKHPRVCGEDPLYQTASGAVAETPPRMRGRPAADAHDDALERNTPAYAGKTLRTMARTAAGEKHPRVCGEDNVRPEDLERMLETPPRMRGRPVICYSDVDVRGNTPAYAGKTRRSRSSGGSG